MEAMNAENAARVDTATLAALLDGDGDGEAGVPPVDTTPGAVDTAPVTVAAGSVAAARALSIEVAE